MKRSVSAAFAAALVASTWTSLATTASAKQDDDKKAIRLVSDLSNASTGDDYSGVAVPSGLLNGLTFGDVAQVSTDYRVADGGVGGGSLRFEIGVVMPDTSTRSVFAYVGDPPSFVEGPDGWRSTGNLAAATDLRWDTSQVGGTFYDTHANAVALVGSQAVAYVVAVVDSGWFFPRQEILVRDTTMNGHALNQLFGGATRK
jgi:hypothetical protein